MEFSLILSQKSFEFENLHGTPDWTIKFVDNYVFLLFLNFGQICPIGWEHPKEQWLNCRASIRKISHILDTLVYIERRVMLARSKHQNMFVCKFHAEEIPPQHGGARKCNHHTPVLSYV